MKNYEVMMKIGGNRWQKADMDRVYINAADADEMYYDLDDEKKTHGRLPINRREKQTAKIWVDVKTDEINVTGTNSDEEVIKCIEELIKANQPEEKEEENTMKKTVYIARVADDNSDAYRAYFTREEAVKTAEMYAAHLTAGERKTHTVSIEVYSIECVDTDTAETAFREALISGETGEAIEYEEV